MDEGRRDSTAAAARVPRRGPPRYILARRRVRGCRALDHLIAHSDAARGQLVLYVCKAVAEVITEVITLIKRREPLSARSCHSLAIRQPRAIESETRRKPPGSHWTSCAAPALLRLLPPIIRRPNALLALPALGQEALAAPATGRCGPPPSQPHGAVLDRDGGGGLRRTREGGAPRREAGCRRRRPEGARGHPGSRPSIRRCTGCQRGCSARPRGCGGCGGCWRGGRVTSRTHAVPRRHGPHRRLRRRPGAAQGQGEQAHASYTTAILTILWLYLLPR